MNTIARLCAILHAASGLVLLLFSGWFIGACAIAGVDYSSVNFNYLLPAVIIRGLALTRIASGYAQMWTGHNALLSQVKSLRLRLFNKLKNKIITRRSEGTEALAKHSETIASLNMAYIAHILGALSMLVIASLALAIWLPQVMCLWFAVLAGIMTLFVVCHTKLTTLSRALLQVNEVFRHNSEHHLDSASLWHLRKHLTHTDQMPGFTLNQHTHTIGERMLWWTQIIGYTGIVMIIVLQAYHGQAVLLVFVLLLLAMKDWLGPFWRAQRAYANYRESRYSFSSLPTTSLPLSAQQPQAIHHLSIQQFCARDRNLTPVTLGMHRNEITLVKGGSGSGKSSLLQALSGLLPHDGKKIVNGDIIPAGVIAHWYYAEQSPTVLSASIASNLRLASPDASEQQLFDALTTAGLGYLNNLNEWIGEQGRQLSGGELKRINVARALLYDAQLYLFDEPFEGLDEDMQQEMAQVINQLAERAPVIVASHIVPANLRADHTVVLEE